MKNILIIGSVGQIGSELTLELRKNYGSNNVVAGYRSTLPKGELLESGPSERVDATDIQQIADVVKKYRIDTIFNLAAILSAVGESKPLTAWNIGIGGLMNCLEVAREHGCAVFTPSSIGAFGGGTPLDNTPQDTIQRPQTMYGVSKVSGELLSDYYHKRFGVDTRSVRYPGIISNVTLPGGGTTDYAVEIYYEAIKNKKFTCPLKAGTFLDMMYMPDAIRAAIDLMEADPARLKHRNSFNITAMSFDPEIIYAEIKKHIPDFTMTYQVEPVKQAIADSWPNKMDDSCARREWGWKPEWDLPAMTSDMLKVIGEKYAKGLI
ncbi:MAG: NAD-dependent epimerase/dehydratase family protein [Bacteroidales bacterium]|jgi:nucleoside-diphosphate-sugar epimerase|nr:NAD-dependent epimerase/dehydratase family protein [Bacteroidales bacterium]MDD2264989.1 NAD-dependent epimerase/dehydratase family protein [Bacteroidales bacterium]MDD2831113.1 NAD-dependent epimerase/dehydratase family protein [Bacteroidales bacterium]MDD3209430.1 NAD-dependent epimerase/dehydratase family protein [Bacteroidales bacterium]MDD3697649.1 NAD-dependent epimerase/dehydratase family protein [Bacteroidales bacterium]